ncbi:MAG: Rrf2 family transcriptional regulator [Candidatus Omnitrophota bacterium]
MRITYKGDYALKAVLDLALNYEAGVVPIHELAERIDAPVKFLEQVLLDLKRGGFVESRRGKIGGYALARPPSQIELGQVIRFIDGPIEPIGCVNEGYANCKDLYKCSFRKVWKEVASAVSGIVDHLTFEDLAKQARGKKEALIYQI